MRGEMFYSALLMLYPKPFRARFGDEMIRLYRDCYPDMGPVALWVEALKDLTVSVPREWRREVDREDSEIDYTGLADAIMGTFVVGTLLLGWGWMGAAYVLKLGRVVQSSDFQFMVVMFVNALLVGGLSTFFAMRSNRIDTKCSLFINSEKHTVQF